MNRNLFLAFAVLWLSACSFNRGVIAPTGGEIGVSSDCSDVSFSASPVYQYQCPNEPIDITWSAPRLPASCAGPLFGTGCISPPGGLGPVCTDVWTEPDDLTTPLLFGDCSIERRAAGECIFCRYPDDGREVIAPVQDSAIQYLTARTFDDGKVSQCYATVPVRIVPAVRTRPHEESFLWVCDDSGEGRWSTVWWDPDEFATRSVRLARIINTSPVPVDVLLRRTNSVGLDEIFIARDVPPGGELPPGFLGAAHGLWAVSPNPIDRYEPAGCPAPPLDDSVGRVPPPPLSPELVPPPMRLAVEMECRVEE